jgi:bifunctional non-homologous end joining protein LigD
MKYVKIEGSKKLSSFIEPMKAQLSDRMPFNSDEWLFEIKWDGYRAIAEVNEKGKKLYSRNGLTFDKAYIKVFEALSELSLPVTLDGEIVVLGSNGQPDFNKLQNYNNKDKDKIQFYVFDVLEINGQDTTSLPLINRKELLKQLLPESDVIKYCDHLENDGKTFFTQMQQLGLEGMIAKRKKSKYLIGKRTSDWLKIKNVKTRDVVIVGFTEPKGSRSYFGSLVLAAYKDGELTSMGNVGTGFDEKTLKDLHQKLKKIVCKSSPLDVPIKEQPDISWVEPVLVCTVAFTEITADGSIRHPVFHGLRVDKSPKEIDFDDYS